MSRRYLVLTYLIMTVYWSLEVDLLLYYVLLLILVLYKRTCNFTVALDCPPPNGPIPFCCSSRVIRAVVWV